MRKAPGYIFYGTKQGTVRKVKLETKTAIIVVRAHIHPIADILFCANGNVISICDQGTVLLGIYGNAQIMCEYMTNKAIYLLPIN
jgi:hypothetical protein